MSDYHGDRSLEPTPHRRQKSREMGQVARSQDLGSALLLLAGLAVLFVLGGGLAAFLFGYAERQLSGAWLTDDLSYGTAEVVSEYNTTLLELARHVLPILGLLLLVAVAANVLQVGFLLLPQKLAPDLTRLDPLRGVQRLFSLENGARLLFGLLKIATIATVAAVSLYGQRDDILRMTDMDVPDVARALVDVLLWTSLKIGGALLVLALLDYGFQRWKHEQDLKMTPDEVREEMKHLEGNRQVASRRKHIERQSTLDRYSAAAAGANLIVTGPANLVLALRYESGETEVPLVVAKGAGAVAARIRRIALDRGIPIVENRVLAQAIFPHVDVDQPIPADQYTAVAEMLVDVRAASGRSSSDRAVRP